MLLLPPLLTETQLPHTHIRPPFSLFRPPLSHLHATVPLSGVRELTVGVNAPDTARDEVAGTTKAWEHDWKLQTATAAVAAMEGRCRLPPALDF